MEIPKQPLNVFLVMPSPSSTNQTNLPSIMPAPPAYPFATPSPSVNSPLKPPKKYRSHQEKILRCKRRIEFGQLSSVLEKPRAASQLRRNERERKRVGIINSTFSHLRNHVPDQYCNPNNAKNTKKLSKVDTLRGAIDYIKTLKNILEDEDALDTACNLLNTQAASATPSASSVPPPSLQQAACVPPSMTSNVVMPEQTLPGLIPPEVFSSPPPVPLPSNLLQPIDYNSMDNKLNLDINGNITNIPAPPPEYIQLQDLNVTSSTCSSGNSPRSFLDSDYQDSAPISPEDKDLINFASDWLRSQEQIAVSCTSLL